MITLDMMSNLKVSSIYVTIELEVVVLQWHQLTFTSSRCCKNFLFKG